MGRKSTIQLPANPVVPRSISADEVDDPLFRHLRAIVAVVEEPSPTDEPSIKDITTTGLDIAKGVFQVHGVDGAG